MLKVVKRMGKLTFRMFDPRAVIMYNLRRNKDIQSWTRIMVVKEMGTIKVWPERVKRKS